MFNLIFVFVLVIIFNFLSFVIYNNEKYRRLPENRKHLFIGIQFISLILIASLNDTYLAIGIFSIIPGMILEGIVFYNAILK